MAPEKLWKWRALRPSPHWVLANVLLPKMAGIALFRKFSKTNGRVCFTLYFLFGAPQRP